MGYIFLSYSRKDFQIMDTLAGQLQQAGFEVWLDRKGIRGGTAWRKEIVMAIEGAAALVVALSPNSAASANVATELDLAKDANKAIIPLEIRATTIPPEMKYQLIGLQRILLEPFEDGIAELVRSLEPFQSIPTAGAETAIGDSERPASNKRPPARKKKAAVESTAAARLQSNRSKEQLALKSDVLPRAIRFGKMAAVVKNAMAGISEDRLYTGK